MAKGHGAETSTEVASSSVFLHCFSPNCIYWEKILKWGEINHDPVLELTKREPSVT